MIEPNDNSVLVRLVMVNYLREYFQN